MNLIPNPQPPQIASKHNLYSGKYGDYDFLYLSIPDGTHHHSKRLQSIDMKDIVFEYEMASNDECCKIYRGMWVDLDLDIKRIVTVYWFKHNKIDKNGFKEYLQMLIIQQRSMSNIVDDELRFKLSIYGYSLNPYALITEEYDPNLMEIASYFARKIGSDMNRYIPTDVVQIIQNYLTIIYPFHTGNKWKRFWSRKQRYNPHIPVTPFYYE